MSSKDDNKPLTSDSVDPALEEPLEYSPECRCCMKRLFYHYRITSEENKTLKEENKKLNLEVVYQFFYG